MRRSALVVVMLLALGGAAWGQEEPVEKKPLIVPQPDRSGIPITHRGTFPPLTVDLVPGDRAPEFKLDSSLGGTVGLADIKGRWSVLIFDESRAKLAPLRVIGAPLLERGVRPYGICRDGVSALRTLVERDSIGFPLLSDPTGQISQLFGMYDTGKDLIRSGIVIVDAQGFIRMVVQGPPLDADDVLQMVKHVLQGT